MATNVPLESLILSPGIAHCLCSIMISDTRGMGIYGICIRCQQLGQVYWIKAEYINRILTYVLWAIFIKKKHDAHGPWTSNKVTG